MQFTKTLIKYLETAIFSDSESSDFFLKEEKEVQTQNETEASTQNIFLGSEWKDILPQKKYWDISVGMEQWEARTVEVAIETSPEKIQTSDVFVQTDINETKTADASIGTEKEEIESKSIDIATSPGNYLNKVNLIESHRETRNDPEKYSLSALSWVSKDYKRRSFYKSNSSLDRTAKRRQVLDIDKKNILFKVWDLILII